MGKTYKHDRARAIHKLGKPHRTARLIPTGNYYNVKDRETGELHGVLVDNGGRRYGQQRKMRAKMKVDARQKARRQFNRNVNEKD